MGIQKKERGELVWFEKEAKTVLRDGCVLN